MILTAVFGVIVLGTSVVGQTTGVPDPQYVPGLNTVLLIVLGVVQNRHYRRSADAEYRSWKVEQRLRRIERKLNMSRREEDDDQDDDAAA